MASRDAKIWAAVRNYLITYPGLPANVVYPSETFDNPDPLTPYIILDDLRFDPVRAYWQGPNWRTGSLMVMVMVPLEWTYSQTVEYAGNIADHFTEDAVMQYDDVTIKVTRQPHIDGSGYRDGSHYRMPVNVRWEGFVD